MTDKEKRIIEIILAEAGLEPLFEGANVRDTITEPAKEVKTML